MEYTLVDITNAQVEIKEYSLVDLYNAQVDMGSTAVQLISPANGATGVSVSPTFEWQALPDTSTYTIKVWDYTGSVKGNLIVDEYVSNTTYTVPTPLQNSTLYLWQVSKANLLDLTEPTPTTEITDISISAGDTIGVGGSRAFTISTTGTGDYDESYTASGTGLTFSIVGNLLTVTESGGVVNDTKTFTVESVADNTVTDSRTLTLVDEGAIATNDSVQTDFEALQAIYTATQGQNLPTLAGTSELPTPENSTYPFMYLINGEIHWLSFGNENDTYRGWENAGTPWTVKTGWDTMTETTMGDAVGIEVDADGRVIEVDMQKITTREGTSTGQLTNGNNLCGGLPPEIGNLKKCKKFNVKQNLLYGALPPEIGFIGTSLERLSLAGHHWEVNLDEDRLWLEASHMHYNRDGGADPFSWSVSGKEVPATNRFRSELPPEFGSLTSLDIIELSHQFITGSYPSEWGNLTSLRGLLIDASRQENTPNALYGELPTSWENLTSMKYFRITGHLSRTLRGRLPSGMLNWNNLVNFAVYTNDLEGEFPAFTALTKMAYFNISRNNFGIENEGQTDEVRSNFPWSSIFNGKNGTLSKFGIGSNRFFGELPDTVPAPTEPIARSKYRLDDFNIRSNDFFGDVPFWVQDLGSMQIINISNNSFTGPFPSGIEVHERLKTVYVQGNELSGPLPDMDWGNRRIGWFYMSNNNFEGEIPDSWISLYLTDTDAMLWDPEEGSGYQDYNLYEFTGTGATLNWSSVAGAVRYQLEIRDVDENIVRRYKSIDTNSFTVSGLPSATYKWRVRGLTWVDTVNRHYFSNNELSGRIPDWWKNFGVDYLSFAGNRYTFKDIENSYTDLVANVTNLFFDSQKPFGTAETITVASGGSYTIDYSALDTAGNSYTWYKDGSVISGETGSSLAITNFGASDEGSYKVEVTNSNYPLMGTIESKLTTLLL